MFPAVFPSLNLSIMKANVNKKELLLEVQDMQMLLALFSECKVFCVEHSFSPDKTKVETAKHLYTLITGFESNILNVVFRDETDYTYTLER